MVFLSALRRQTLSLMLLLFGVTLVTFTVSHVVPVDPAGLLTGDRASPEVMAQTRRELGLDLPLHEQYLNYLAALARGDLGRSIASGRPVAADLASTMPATMVLVGVSLVLAIIVGVPLGLAAGFKEKHWQDRGVRFLDALGPSAPPYWLALLVAWLIGALHMPSEGEGVGILLPAMVLAFAAAAPIAGASRRAARLLAGRGYVAAARAGGLSLLQVVLRHGVDGVVRPGLGRGGEFLAAMLAGTLLVEAAFAWPGAGAYAAGAVAAADFPAVMGFALAVAVFGLALRFLFNLYAEVSDPALKVAPDAG